MKRRLLGAASAVVVGLTLAGPVAPADAAGFCATKTGLPTYYQHDFSASGSVVATICAPASIRRATPTCTREASTRTS